MSNNMIIGMDFANGPARTILCVYGVRYGKTFLMRLWELRNTADLISKQLIRRLAAEAILTVSLTS